jgi:hypothetical protein
MKIRRGKRDGELTLSWFSDILEPNLMEGGRSVRYLPEMSFR